MVRLEDTEMFKKYGQFRDALCILYPDSTSYSYQSYLDMLLRLNGAKVYCMLHDRDCDADGVMKKPHLHVLISFDNRRSVAKLKVLFPNVQFFECSDPVSSLVYFTHSDDASRAAGKSEYQVSEFLSTVDKSVIQSIIDKSSRRDKADDSKAAADIAHFILSHHPSLEQTLNFVFSHGYWSTWRKGQTTFLKLVGGKL